MPSRRSVIAGMAAGLLPAAPALALGSDDGGPDARILDLGRRYQQLMALEVAADEAYEQCYEAFQEPERPEVLRHRIEDHAGGLHLPLIRSPYHRWGLSSDPSRNQFYTEDEVERLRYVPPPIAPEQLADQRARIAEIERAHEAWLARCRLAEEEAGLNATEEAIEHIVEAMRSLAKEIAAMPAKTMAGLRVRAQILADILEGEEVEEDVATDELMLRAIVRDLLGMVA